MLLYLNKSIPLQSFSCPNDEFAAQMPLISHSPANQLMNSSGLSLEGHLEQSCRPLTHPCMVPVIPTPPHTTPWHCRLQGRGWVTQGGRSSGMSSQGPALVLVKQSQCRFLLILAEGRSTTYRAEKWCRVIFVLLTSSERVLRVTVALFETLAGLPVTALLKGRLRRSERLRPGSGNVPL